MNELDPLLARVRNLVHSLGVSDGDVASILRRLLAEFSPDFGGDAQLRRETEFWTGVLHAEGFKISPDLLIATDAAARVLDCHEVTLRDQRCNGVGPPLQMLNGRPRYSLPALLAWRSRA